jgi:hypothetical protein
LPHPRPCSPYPRAHLRLGALIGAPAMGRRRARLRRLEPEVRLFPIGIARGGGSALSGADSNCQRLRAGHDALGGRRRVPAAPPVAPRARVSPSARAPPPRHPIPGAHDGRAAARLAGYAASNPSNPRSVCSRGGIPRRGAWQRRGPHAQMIEDLAHHRGLRDRRDDALMMFLLLLQNLVRAAGPSSVESLGRSAPSGPVPWLRRTTERDRSRPRRGRGAGPFSPNSGRCRP